MATMSPIDANALAAEEAESAAAPPSATDDQPWSSPRLAWYALTLLVLATMMNFFDVGVFGLMVEYIKRDFQLSDFGLSLLMGPAGILFYVVVGIPLARLVDIYSRRMILGVGLLITSGMTSLSGLTQSFGQFFLLRAFTGVGGSAHAPGTYSMIADLFPPQRLPRAFGVLQLGFILGAGLAPIIGGWALSHMAAWQPTQVGPLLIHGWQWLLLATGVPGLIIACFIFALPEPARRGTVAGGKGLPLRVELQEIGKRRGVYFPLFIGLALSSLEATGVLIWRVPLMMRSYHWGPMEIGAWAGLTAFVAMPLGAAFGTWLTEHLSKRHKDAPVRTTAIAFALCIPFSVASPLMPTGELSTLVAAFGGLFGIAAGVPQNTAIQTITPNEMRAQVTAVYLFMFTFFGAMGSTVVALITDHLVGGPQNLWLSLSIAAATLLPLAVYAITRAMKPYAAEIERLEALKAA